MRILLLQLNTNLVTESLVRDAAACPYRGTVSFAVVAQVLATLLLRVAAQVDFADGRRGSNALMQTVEQSEENLRRFALAAVEAT